MYVEKRERERESALVSMKLRVSESVLGSEWEWMSEWEWESENGIYCLLDKKTIQAPMGEGMKGGLSYK